MVAVHASGLPHPTCITSKTNKYNLNEGKHHIKREIHNRNKKLLAISLLTTFNKIRETTNEGNNKHDYSKHENMKIITTYNTRV